MDEWQPLRPDEVAELFASYDRPWWIAGGWALDLFLGEETRAHEDIDVEVVRSDQFAVQRLLAGWDQHVAHAGELRPWLPGVPLRDEVNSTWARRTPDGPWLLQLMFPRVEDGLWHYRRQPAITRPLATLLHHTPTGTPYLAPEVQLLFKSRAPREKDDADFERVLPALDAEQRTWLCESLGIAGDPHDWASRLVTDS